MAPDTINGPAVTAVAFDVLGTLLDEDAGRLAAVRSAFPDLGDDAAEVARDWSERLAQALAAVVAGEQPFRGHDELELSALTEVAAARGLSLPRQRMAEVARFGHRLEPFPGTTEALAELRAELPVLALTNAGLGQAAAMSAHVGWEWTAVVSSESVCGYKPDPRMYRAALAVLGLPAERVLLVAAHEDDLDAAAGQGLRTAFLDRRGAGGERFDLTGPDLATLVRAVTAGGQPTSSSRRSRT